MARIITKLKRNQVLVVGTNANGEHMGGAARQAWESFGALWGIAEGPLGGQAYGIVTLNTNMNQVGISQLQRQAEKLRNTARNNQDTQFLLTPVGTGIAGFTVKQIDKIFTNMPDNVIRVGEW